MSRKQYAPAQILGRKLWRALWDGHDDVARFFLHFEDVDVNVAGGGIPQWTTLMLAVWHVDAEIVQVLIEKGADVTKITGHVYPKDQFTPLRMARVQARRALKLCDDRRVSDCEKIIELLVAAGAKE
jgi:hypothetical protein